MHDFVCRIAQMQENYGASGFFVEGETLAQKKQL